MYKGVGEVEGVSAVSARFAVERYNLQERDAALADADVQLVNHYRGLYRTLRPHGQRT